MFLTTNDLNCPKELATIGVKRLVRAFLLLINFCFNTVIVTHPVLSAAAARSSLRPPSLQTLLEDVPYSAAVPHKFSFGGDSEGKSKYELFIVLSFRRIFC
ncbi:hypothetical protein F0562_030906 [Nyssa sinensis]|uniref:Uncharacterized protein n=1 Tax=Nyssa sinensis TaxID=561372 RepID=A0A5J5ASX5_9ASTE|nr:hypothetical protein F0562_030906 [Nyssa sinensis]